MTDTTTGSDTATVIPPNATTPTIEPKAESGTDTGAAAETPTDWKARAREWEKRAKENSKAADRLAELEEAQKTAEQKLADKATAAERERDEARLDALRYRVATRYGITDADAEAFLHGPDEETIVRQAERLVALAKPGGPKPDHSQGAVGGTDAGGDMNALIRGGLRRGS